MEVRGGRGRRHGWKKNKEQLEYPDREKTVVKVFGFYISQLEMYCGGCSIKSSGSEW